MCNNKDLRESFQKTDFKTLQWKSLHNVSMRLPDKTFNDANVVDILSHKVVRLKKLVKIDVYLWQQE